jgi:hypothetical protein
MAEFLVYKKPFRLASNFAASSRVARFFLAQYTKTGENNQKDHKIFKMITEYTKFSKKYIKWPLYTPKVSIARPSKICQYWDFWFENIYHLATLAARHA